MNGHKTRSKETPFRLRMFTFDRQSSELLDNLAEKMNVSYSEVVRIALHNMNAEVPQDSPLQEDNSPGGTST